MLLLSSFIFQDAKRGTELDYVIARKNPLYTKPVYLELWGSPLFAIRQKIASPETTEGTILLLGPLDFETQSMYHLTVLANVSRKFYCNIWMQVFALSHVFDLNIEPNLRIFIT